MSSAPGAVFLSYASQDREAAKAICDALRATGVEVWFDQSELVGGDVWDAKIRKQIAECALFVPVISANTQARLEGYFRLEWKLSAQRTLTMADEKVFLLPVVLDDTRDADAKVPVEFRAVQWTRLRPAGYAGPALEEQSLAGFCARVGILLGLEAKTRASRPGTENLVQADPVTGASSGIPASAVDTPQMRQRTGSRHPLRLLAAAALFLALGLGAMLALSARRSAKARRVHETVLPQIEQSIAAKDWAGAFDLAMAAERDAPGDAMLKAIWPRIAVVTSIETTPPGADIFVKDYYKPQAEWRLLGKSPLKGVRLPNVYTRWKIQKEGFAPLERALGVDAPVSFTLDPVAAVPADMVRVEGGLTRTYRMGLAAVRLDDFFIDRYEVTNRQFKEFVDRKGYENPDYWQQPFERGGKTLTRREALAEFHDSTGRPGPAGWRNGSYPEGEADFPVTGVSWFEAAAYAQFAGKRLPTIYHWRYASLVADFESMVPLSNFSGKGMARVGTYAGMSAAGVYDMAGNAREWCWNSGGPDRRYVLGGAWREAPYSFGNRDAQAPFERPATVGFRCMRLIGTSPLPPLLDAELLVQLRNYAEEKPVSDEIFRTFRSLYAYDKTPLQARAEGVDDTDPRWRKEKISFVAAYGNERIPTYVFLPKNSAPPFQAVIYFPSSDAIGRRSTEGLADLEMVAMLVASGRAVICPIYKSTYERNDRAPPGSGLNFFRDQMVMMSKDLGRAIDYLETRPDLQAGKLAFFGYSAGGTYGIILPTLEPRLKVSVLVAAGFTQNRALPESDPINFAPRNTIPTLVLNGRYDFQRPLETSQLPMFKLLGAPADQKRHVLFETSHTLKPEQIAGEVYVWLDRYLGEGK